MVLVVLKQPRFEVHSITGYSEQDWNPRTSYCVLDSWYLHRECELYLVKGRGRKLYPTGNYTTTRRSCAEQTAAMLNSDPRYQ